MDLQPVDSVFTAVPSVCDGDGGDDVGLQQVHPPPGVGLFVGVGA